jgi:hypothetical protein
MLNKKHFNNKNAGKAYINKNTYYSFFTKEMKTSNEVASIDNNL